MNGRPARPEALAGDIKEGLALWAGHGPFRHLRPDLIHHPLSPGVP